MSNLLSISWFSRLTFPAVGLIVATTGFTQEEVKINGTVCWTGDIAYIGTDEKNTAWSWKIDWVWTSDDDDPAKTQLGQCFGTGGMVEGQPNIPNYYCVHNLTDDGKYMSIGQAQPDETHQSKIFGGIGQYAGIEGSFTGTKELQLPAGDGRVAGCRHTSGSYVITQ